MPCARSQSAGDGVDVTEPNERLWGWRLTEGGGNARTSVWRLLRQVCRESEMELLFLSGILTVDDIGAFTSQSIPISVMVHLVLSLITDSLHLSI